MKASIKKPNVHRKWSLSLGPSHWQSDTIFQGVEQTLLSTQLFWFQICVLEKLSNVSANVCVYWSNFYNNRTLEAKWLTTSGEVAKKKKWTKHVESTQGPEQRSKGKIMWADVAKPQNVIQQKSMSQSEGLHLISIL